MIRSYWKASPEEGPHPPPGQDTEHPLRQPCMRGRLWGPRCFPTNWLHHTTINRKRQTEHVRGRCKKGIVQHKGRFWLPEKEQAGAGYFQVQVRGDKPSSEGQGSRPARPNGSLPSAHPWDMVAPDIRRAGGARGAHRSQTFAKSSPGLRPKSRGRSASLVLGRRCHVLSLGEQFTADGVGRKLQDNVALLVAFWLGGKVQDQKFRLASVSPFHD